MAMTSEVRRGVCRERSIGRHVCHFHTLHICTQMDFIRNYSFPVDFAIPDLLSVLMVLLFTMAQGKPSEMVAAVETVRPTAKAYRETRDYEEHCLVSRN